MQPQNWLGTPLGRRCLSHEQRLVRRALDCVFGIELLQVGTWGPRDAFIRHARTQRVAILDDRANGGEPDVVSRLDRLGIVSDSIDAILMPHTLERCDSPHAALREAARVLRPDGCLIALGFLPTGLWGMRHLLARGGYPAGSRHLIRIGRLHDWLELLSFDVDPAVNYCHTLPLERFRRVGGWPRERWANRWLPMLAGGYMTIARKRAVSLTPVRGVRQRPRLRAVGGLVEPTTRVSRRASD
ncbi:MAG TPA: methyltransferase domain-containing protein [Gammaproteobacteria bacterium]|nr:methyltransferase domain-containing protein [Gammaproteobacteria bacterium]